MDNSFFLRFASRYCTYKSGKYTFSDIGIKRFSIFRRSSKEVANNMIYPLVHDMYQWPSYETRTAQVHIDETSDDHLNGAKKGQK